MISILIPCFNKSSFITETLITVNKQSYTNWECIIVDDGSTDTSITTIQQFIAEKPRFKLIQQKNAGVSAARNNAFAHATGNYILPLDADDKIHHEYLNETMQVFNKNPKYDIVYCLASFFGDRTGQWNLPPFCPKKILNGNMVFNAAVMKRKVFESIGGFSADFKQGIEDWDFWLSAVEKNFSFYRIEKELFFYRITDNSRTVSYKESAVNKEKMYSLLVSRHIHLYQKNWGSFISVYRNYVKLSTLVKKIEQNIWLCWQVKLFRKIQKLKKTISA